ncbi:MAG: pre-peptidase C-terminal domain-containing protein [Eubacterium sp.]
MKKLRLFIVTLILVTLAGISVAAATTVNGSGQTVTVITPKLLTASDYQTSNLTQYTLTYTNSDVVSISGSSYSGMIVPITVAKPGDVTINISDNNVTKGSYIEVYKDYACTSLADSSYFYLYSGSSLSSKEFTFSAAGTYYIAFYTSVTTNSSYTNSVTVSAYEYSRVNTTLTSGNWVLSAESDGNTYVYYKVVTTKKGYITIATRNQNLSFSICDSSKMTLESSCYISSSNDYRATFALKAGTYYIKTYGAIGSEYKLRYVFSTDPVVKSGKTVTMYPGTYNQNIYVKFKATQTGYITVSDVNGACSYVTLCNNKKKELSSDDYVYSSSSTVFGVVKGKTYYLKTKSYDDKVTIKVKLKKINDKSKNKKSKAYTLKRGKVAKGVIPAGVGKADWYKIKVTSTKQVKLTMVGSSSGTLKVYLYNGTTGASFYNYLYTTGINSGGTYKLYNRTDGKLQKGTYYIKVVRGSKKSSGWYKLKWK